MIQPTWPTFDVAEIAEEASERAGIEFRSGYALRTARRSLELLSIEWANRGLNLWTVDGPITINLQPGVAQYSLPEDTVDLVEYVYRVPPASPGLKAQDFPLDRWSFSDYAAIPNKQAPGNATLICVRRMVRPYFLLWMVPHGAGDQLVYWRLRRMRPLGVGGAGEPDVPWRFITAMTAGLAYYLAVKAKQQDPNRIQILKSDYEEQFGLAADEDRDRATVRLVPGGSYGVI